MWKLVTDEAGTVYIYKGDKRYLTLVEKPCGDETRDAAQRYCDALNVNNSAEPESVTMNYQ